MATIDYSIRRRVSTLEAEFAASGIGGGGSADTSGLLKKASNLSDVQDPVAARGFLGLSTAATHPTTDFIGSGATLDQIAAANADVDLGGHRLKNVAVATTGTDALSRTAADTRFDATGAASAAQFNASGAALQKSGNLADVQSAVNARSNLGLGSVATHAVGEFDATGAASAAQFNASGAALQKSGNLADLQSAVSARSNLGLGSVATHAVGEFDVTGAASAAQFNASGAAMQKSGNLADVANAQTARVNLGVGGVYRGLWNPATNTPSLASGSGVVGDFYKVSASGNLNLGAGSAFSVNDWVEYDGTVWQQQSGPFSGLTFGSNFATEHFGTPASAVAAAASATWVSTLVIPVGSVPAVITGLRYQVGTQSNGTVKACIYDSNGNLIAVKSAGAAQSAINQLQTVNFDSPVVLNTPGRYFVGLVFAASNGSFVARPGWGQLMFQPAPSTLVVTSNTGISPPTILTV